MKDEFPSLNLEAFAHGYESFFAATYNLLSEAEDKGVLKYILTEDINSQYKYSNQKRTSRPTMDFLKDIYLTGKQEVFLPFFNEILPNILEYLGKEEWQYSRVHQEQRSNFRIMLYKLVDLIINSNNPSVFSLDFHYDKESKTFRRKLDEVNTTLINSNDEVLDGDNKIRYQECVNNFLSYKKDLLKDNKLFYNNSLNDLKKVIESALQNNYKKEDGTFPKISERRWISNILFGENNTDFEKFLDYVIKNIHHEEGGQPKNFTEKEYIYLWLALNNVLYLLNRYKAN